MPSKIYQINQLFHVIMGDGKYTSFYGHENPGKYPIYSAALSTPLTHTNTFDHDGNFLSWTANGYAGRISELSGQFSINKDRGLLIPISENLHLGYIKKVLEPKLLDQVTGRIVDGEKNEYTKLSHQQVAATAIPIPVDKAGNPDYLQQEKIVRNIPPIEACQSSIRELFYKLSYCFLPMTLKRGQKKTLKLSNEKCFSLLLGNRFKKEDVLHEGVPLYSAKVSSPFGFLEKSNIRDNFSKPSMIWGIDHGDFDWRYMPEKKEFAISDHCGRLTLNDSRLHPKYVYCFLKSTRFKYEFDRNNYRASIENMRESVTIDVPTDKNGNLDIDLQIDMAQRYENMEKAREVVLSQLKSIYSNTISLKLPSTS